MGFSLVELAASSGLAIAVQLVAHGNFAVRPRLEAVLCRDDGITQLLGPRLKQVVRRKRMQDNNVSRNHRPAILRLNA